MTSYYEAGPAGFCLHQQLAARLGRFPAGDNKSLAK